ncbi:conserved hypothetical protein [Talaromyces stipitatus ATCC 10500]|uniref:GET complex, subunit GET2 n=1 Tax=Talaromyces stipitatus (strain ATCC 10500 / CBS 375.48 / QM 6759 / NRRL 1006) TaxID=441959 RepID=B8LWK8_TALSN|nr:uncharacterized protein TSTA_077640 [Talaromyces stipitatus ATCC 10500]EED24405.1 conserved hypothetical protein [Talaromyces stipitatus ATCC 10500]
MSSAEESPAQQAARLRRERREAKIKAGGSARLDKITSLSGRTPASLHDASPSPSPQPRPQAGSTPYLPTQTQPSQPSPQPPTPATGAAENDTETIRAQQEYLRALLRANPPEQQAQQQIDQDPMMKVLSSMLGGIPGAENTAPGAGMPPQNQGDLGMNDLASALGIPPLFSNMIFGGGATQQTPEEKKRENILKLLHIIFALFIGVYLVTLVSSAVTTYGVNPPPPATAQNPFVVFMTGELVLNGARVVLGKPQQGPLATGLQIFRSLVRDSGIAIFALGVASWWNGGWQISASQ